MVDRMRVIGIDTAGPVIGIAYVDDIQQYSWEKRVAKGADAFLLERLSWMLTQYDPNLIAISVGPGSFTSLRVGVSIALGIAESRKLSVVPVSSLEARAKLFPSPRCLALLDARKGRVYGQFFDSTQPEPIARTEPQDIALSALIPNEEFIAVGEGAVVYRQQIIEGNGFVPSDGARSPALQVAEIGRLRANDAIDPLYVSLDYIRAAGVVPPKNLGIAVGKAMAQKAEEK